jgi:hypothetical protein
LPHNLLVSSEFAPRGFFRLRSGQGRRLSGRQLALVLLAGSFAAILCASVAAKSKPLPAISSRPDPGYISALSAANRFLQAWQNQDHETGLLMLTDAAKQHSSEEKIAVFFSSGADAAYEIARGKRLKTGIYTFPVTLFASHSHTTQSSTNQPTRPQKSEIIVVRTGKDEWAIDKLP